MTSNDKDYRQERWWQWGSVYNAQIFYLYGWSLNCGVGLWFHHTHIRPSFHPDFHSFHSFIHLSFHTTIYPSCLLSVHTTIRTSNHPSFNPYILTSRQSSIPLSLILLTLPAFNATINPSIHYSFLPHHHPSTHDLTIFVFPSIYPSK